MNFRTDHIGTDPEPNRKNTSGSQSIYVTHPEFRAQQPTSSWRLDCSNPRLVPITAYYPRRKSQLEEHEFELRERRLERQAQTRRLSTAEQHPETISSQSQTRQLSFPIERPTEQPPAYESIVDNPPSYTKALEQPSNPTTDSTK